MFGIGVQIIVSLHVWESNLGSTKEQLLLLTPELSLQNPGLEFVIHLPEPLRCREGWSELFEVADFVLESFEGCLFSKHIDHTEMNSKWIKCLNVPEKKKKT